MWYGGGAHNELVMLSPPLLRAIVHRHRTGCVIERPSRLNAWVYEDYVGIHNTTLCNTTIDIEPTPGIPRHVKKYVVADKKGHTLICPISLSPIYWWDCISIGNPAAVFSTFHLVTNMVECNDFRHPLTRLHIQEFEVKKAYRMLIFNNRPNLAAGLFKMYVIHQNMTYDAEDAIVYENVASLIMDEMMQYVAFPPIHIPVKTREVAFKLILGQYMHHVNISILSGKVRVSYILYTIRRHAQMAAAHFGAHRT
jgi:hypothetical protein